MRLSSVIFLLFFPIVLLAQEAVEINNGEKYQPGSIYPFLEDLYKSNDYVISYRIRMTDKINERSDYFIMTRKNNILTAYQFLDQGQQLKAMNLPKKSLELVWDTFVQNELFSIQDEKDIPNFCLSKYQIYNSHTYEFVLVNKGTVKKLSYYDPEYYDNACYGMPERRKIINSASVINFVLTE